MTMWVHAAAILLLLAAGSPPAEAQSRDIRRIPRVQASILVPRLVYAPKSRITILLKLRNPTEVPVDLPSECLDGSTFTLRKVPAEAIRKPRRVRREKDLTLAPGKQFEMEYRLDKIFRKLKATGRYTLSWKCGGWDSEIAELYVADPYDPERDKVAVMTTNLGVMEFVFMPLRAPEHVRTFVQLARNGFYDGLQFHSIVPGVQAETGDRWKGDGTGGWQHMMPPEMDPRLAPMKGMIGAQRRGQTSMTSVAQIFILLEPSPAFRGMHTFFAYLRKGEEVLDAFSQIPTSEAKRLGAFRPLKPVRIESIEIREE